ncbi:MAG: DUF368 domain-containing protein [Streptosporangiales bacterium]|nr:DUF368 domain-containing protein [Streptosporangiales bacterium]
MPSVWKDSPLNLVRGGLIGTAEVIPGVSGGTLALVTGVYDTLISSADHLVSAVRLLVTDGLRGRGLSRVTQQLRQVRWGVLVPLILGMAAAVLVGARLLEPVLETYPEPTRAVFAGMILASVAVPIRAMGGRLRAVDGLLILVATVVAATLTGLPPASVTDPKLIAVAGAAAFAICALVLPGVSGSFLLLTLGLYAPTIAAINDRNLAYLASFAVGALLGLSAFVKILQWLLTHRRRVTLAVMTGLMIGSLRALWPWQGEDRNLLPPSGDVALIAVLAALGAALVVTLIVVEHRLHRRRAAAEATAGQADERRREPV